MTPRVYLKTHCTIWNTPLCGMLCGTSIMVQAVSSHTLRAFSIVTATFPPVNLINLIEYLCNRRIGRQDQGFIITRQGSLRRIQCPYEGVKITS